MTKCKKPTPYDPKLIAERCNPLALRLGCAAGCWKGENFKQCGKPPVAIRRWGRDDGYDDSELLPEEGVYGPACKLHANHDVVPLSEVLKAVADAGCWKHDPSLMPPLSGVWPWFSDFLQESFFERMIIVVSVRFSSTQLRNRKSRSIFQNVVLKKGCCADAKN